MKRTAIALGVISLWAATALAQGRNFAGTWIHDDEKTRVANGITGTVIGVAVGANGEMSPSSAPPMVVAVDGSSITIGVKHYKAGGTTTFELRGEIYKTKAEWKDDKLVTEETVATANGPMVVNFTWYLEGQYLVRERPRAAAEGSTAKVFKSYFVRAKATTAR